MIGNHVWIGKNVLVGKGVKISSNSVVAAYSKVTNHLSFLWGNHTEMEIRLVNDGSKDERLNKQRRSSISVHRFISYCFELLRAACEAQ